MSRSAAICIVGCFNTNSITLKVFTDCYDVTRLLYWESYDEVYKALDREKQLKGWTRAKKIALIERRNPHRVDLAAEWYPWMEPGEGRDASTSH